MQDFLLFSIWFWKFIVYGAWCPSKLVLSDHWTLDANCHIGVRPQDNGSNEDTDENDDGEDYHRGEYHRLYDDDDNDDA